MGFVQQSSDKYSSRCLVQLKREWSVLLPQLLLGFLRFSVYSCCSVWPFFGTDTLSPLFKDDCLLFWKWLPCSTKTSEVPLQSIKRLVYLLSAIDYYLILDFFPQGKENNLCAVSGLFCGQREAKALMQLTEEAVQLWIKVHLFSFSSQVSSQKIYCELKCSENCQVVDVPRDKFLCLLVGQMQPKQLLHMMFPRSVSLVVKKTSATNRESGLTTVVECSPLKPYLWLPDCYFLNTLGWCPW